MSRRLYFPLKPFINAFTTTYYYLLLLTTTYNSITMTDCPVTDKVYTITFGDVAENHAKMQKIGTLHDAGYSIQMLEDLQDKLRALGLTTLMVDLNAGFHSSFQDAKVLVIRRGAQFILGDDDTSLLIAENDRLTMDKHALMRGKVVNKHARWNLCFADDDQEPNYHDGKGRVVAWRHIPRMDSIRHAISQWTQDVLLNGEANYYYDISKCGIGYHGDAERRKVFAVRMGATMPLYFKWFQFSEPVGDPIEVVLHDGDMYIMSEKAVGFDWLKKKTATLRHSTGCAKFTGYWGGAPVKPPELRSPLTKGDMKADMHLPSDPLEAVAKADVKADVKGDMHLPSDPLEAVVKGDKSTDKSTDKGADKSNDESTGATLETIMDKVMRAQRVRFDELMMKTKK